MKLTKEQFRAQFNMRVILTDEQRMLAQPSQVLYGYTIYRLLEKLLLLDVDGEFYCYYEGD